MFIIFGILILSFIVFFHELGHFLAAKAFHVGVVEFALGMGPRVVSRRIGETVYALRLFPVGGFCAMYGETSAEAKDKGQENEKSRRMNYKTDWAPERALNKATKAKQVLIYLAGPMFNILLAFLAAFFMTFVPDVRMGLPVIASLSEEVHVAEEAGIQPGDTILAVEDRIVRHSQDYSTYLSTHPKLEKSGYNLILRRPDGEIYQTFLVPDAETGLVGIAYAAGPNTPGFNGKLLDAFYSVRHWALVCFDSLGMIVRGDAGIADMSGFIGVTSFMGGSLESAASQGTVEMTGLPVYISVLRVVLSLITFISVNLGVMNMLPLPALDGGQMLICWAEGAFNKTVPERAQNMINAVGFGLLLILIGTTTITDVLRLWGIL